MMSQAKDKGMVRHHVQVTVDARNHLIVTHEVTSDIRPAYSWKRDTGTNRRQHWLSKPNVSIRSATLEISTTGKCWRIAARSSTFRTEVKMGFGIPFEGDSTTAAFEILAETGDGGLVIPAPVQRSSLSYGPRRVRRDT